MAEPNVVLLDEPTNDLDIETLTELEDLLDGWPGTLVVVSHDRYFLERVTDNIFAIFGDGTLPMLPGGVDEYLAKVASHTSSARPVPVAPSRAGGGQDWKARKELDRLERRLEKLSARETELHELLAAHAADYGRLVELGDELKAVQSEKDTLEEEWLTLADDLG
jgi:ATP-binding cassette subfamily F protein uup